MTQIIDVDYNNLGAVNDALQTALKNEHATDKEIRQTLLLVEEITVKFRMVLPNAPVKASVSRKFGKLAVKLSAPGVEHDPIVETQNWAAGTEDYYRTLILRAHKHLINYHRLEGQNVVTILVHTEEKKYVHYSLVALIGGLILGALLHMAASANTLAWLDRNLFSVIQAVFMNAMAIMVVPAVFCAVVNSITSLSSLSDTGRMGTKIMTLYSLTTVFAIVIAFSLGVPLFTRFITEVPTLGVAAESTLTNPSLREFIIGIVPDSLLAPMESGNMVQVLFLAVIAGVAMGLLDEKVEPLHRLIESLDNLFQTMIHLIAVVVPILTFVSTASLVGKYGIRLLPVLLLLMLVESFSCLLMFGLYNTLILIFGKTNPKPYAKKTLKFFRHTDLQASSGEYLPKVVSLCTGKLGVSERVASFSAALGASVNMDGSAIHMVSCSVLMAQLFGIDITSHTMLLIGFTAFILSFGAAAVQNSGMLSVSSLAMMMGIPTTAITLLFGVDQILDLSRTASNAIGDVAVCVIIANQENELDAEEYLSA